MYDKTLSKEKDNYLKAIAVTLIVLIYLFVFPDRIKEMISIINIDETSLKCYIRNFG